MGRMHLLGSGIALLSGCAVRPIIKPIQAMKKLPNDYRARQFRILAHREKRLRKGADQKSGGDKTEIRDAEYVALTAKKELQLAPSHISFYPEHLDETVEFISSIQRNTKTSRLLLDFSETSYISAAGATYLFSELCLVRKRSENRRVTIFQGAMPQDTFRALHKFGIFHLVNGTYPPDGSLMPIHAGEKDQNSDEIAKFLVEEAVQFGEISADPQSKAKAENYAHRAIQEAMLNVWHHAYPEELDNEGWWVTAAILEEKLFIALCDRGIGMPKTLPLRGWWENVMGRLPINTDAEMIEAAMEYTRTSKPSSARSSARKGRGLGTKDMQNLVLERAAGHMTVVSGRGHYRLDGESGKGEKNTFSNDIMGTMIQWAIPLGES